MSPLFPLEIFKLSLHNLKKRILIHFYGPLLSTQSLYFLQLVQFPLFMFRVVSNLFKIIAFNNNKKNNFLIFIEKAFTKKKPL
jgi:hypothetical protein